MRILKVTDLAQDFRQDWCSTLLSLNVFMGENCMSAFKGKRKVCPPKKLIKHPKYQSHFKQLDEKWFVAEETYEMIEAVLCLMYGYAKCKLINQVRSKMLKKMVRKNQKLNKRLKFGLARLKPCQDLLVPNIERVNHQLACSECASTPISRDPSLPKVISDEAWMLRENWNLFGPEALFFQSQSLIY